MSDFEFCLPIKPSTLVTILSVQSFWRAQVRDPEEALRITPSRRICKLPVTCDTSDLELGIL